MRSNVQVAVAALATMARPLRVRITHTPLDDPPIAADGYRVRARIQSTAPIADRTASGAVRRSIEGSSP